MSADQILNEVVDEIHDLGELAEKGLTQWDTAERAWQGVKLAQQEVEKKLKHAQLQLDKAKEAFQREKEAIELRRQELEDGRKNLERERLELEEAKMAFEQEKDALEGDHKKDATAARPQVERDSLSRDNVRPRKELAGLGDIEKTGTKRSGDTLMPDEPQPKRIVVDDSNDSDSAAGDPTRDGVAGVAAGRGGGRGASRGGIAAGRGSRRGARNGGVPVRRAGGRTSNDVDTALTYYFPKRFR